MAAIIADNIISPLGSSSGANYQAVKAGKTALRLHNHKFNLPFPFTAALFSEEQKEEFTIDGLTLFESLAVTSIRKALEGCQIPLDSRTCLVLSSTKQNISLLNIEGNPPENVLYPGRSAERIAQTVGLSTTPIIVCNACISGVSALILGNRLIEMQEYDYVIVCGIDLQSSFIISGFHSLKALSETPCRPFDIERTGLNLGEAAATVILGKVSQTDRWNIAGSAIRNDAYHVSSPAPKADGCLMTLEAVMKGQDASKLSVINAHGTATLYNDQMEARGICRAGLSDIPVNALKGYYGHTMGAAGILETIITLHAAEDDTIVGTKGYEEVGVSGNLNIVRNNTATAKKDFVKLISGFGGCNAAVLLTPSTPLEGVKGQEIETLHKVTITPQSVLIDNEVIDTGQQTGKALLTYLYKTYIQDYPKFYKMDALARLGFIATELLIQKEQEKRGKEQEAGSERAVIFFGQSSSINADKEFLASIADPENFFPSPASFVYTLPNIVNGEVAIRNNYHGETAFYILPRKDDDMMRMITQATMLDNYHKSILTGWLDYRNEEDFLAELRIEN
ncbi:MAG: 3-oxoacyl-ACP synthase [Bacteroidaceae bacterium]|nr:3-oxoacyl-ACP synthase [Bacteroidaceae bacterium]